LGTYDIANEGDEIEEEHHRERLVMSVDVRDGLLDIAAHDEFWIERELGIHDGRVREHVARLKSMDSGRSIEC
jgi:hypothetical protein